MNFLEEGNKVKAYVHFRGRAIAYKEKGEIILLKFAQALEDYGKVELLPKLFTIDSGELTPTLKLKRKIIHGKYKELIERMYE